MPQIPYRRRRAVRVAPGSDERKAAKARPSVADEVILDLEDAVALDQNEDTRDAVRVLVDTCPTAAYQFARKSP